MNTIEIAFAIIVAFAAGMLLSWQLAKTHWANTERAIRDAFGSLAADALHKNNQAFVTLAESRLSEKVTEAKGNSRARKRQSTGWLSH
jgi:hypothetical protein